jgi:hypothetical protein
MPPGRPTPSALRSPLASSINKQLPAIVADCVSQGADRAVLERIQAGIEACANEHLAIAPRIARVSLD